jgi:phospholipase/carboxylesterase
LPEGSVHLTLPRVLRDEVVRLGWGEPHPIAISGIFTSLLTVYAPRDREEIETVFALVMQSCEFAHGKLRDLYSPERPLRESR